MGAVTYPTIGAAGDRQPRQDSGPDPELFRVPP